MKKLSIRLDFKVSLKPLRISGAARQEVSVYEKWGELEIPQIQKG